MLRNLASLSVGKWQRQYPFLECKPFPIMLQCHNMLDLSLNKLLARNVSLNKSFLCVSLISYRHEVSSWTISVVSNLGCQVESLGMPFIRQFIKYLLYAKHFIYNILFDSFNNSLRYH